MDGHPPREDGVLTAVVSCSSNRFSKVVRRCLGKSWQLLGRHDPQIDDEDDSGVMIVYFL